MFYEIEMSVGLIVGKQGTFEPCKHAKNLHDLHIHGLIKLLIAL